MKRLGTLSILLGLLLGCEVISDEEVRDLVDADGDGYESAEMGGDDCDDSDPSENPSVQWYPDADEDGFGDQQAEGKLCEPANPSDVRDNTDCDDQNPDYNPEVTWYPDADGDSYGSPDPGDGGTTSSLCEPASPTDVTNDLDCDDFDAAAFAGQVWYPDCDHDQYFSQTGLSQCERPTSVAACSFQGTVNYTNEMPTDSEDDCDDGKALINPGADEVCDVEDNDCDGDIDDADDNTIYIESERWYVDSDGDDYGDPASFTDTCIIPTQGYTQGDEDCDDSDGDTHPGAAAKDNPSSCMRDRDGDGYGDMEALAPIEPGTDCDDDMETTFPGAASAEATAGCHADADDDGLGDWAPPLGVDAGSDCDDTDVDIGSIFWYFDQDRDGYGGANSSLCEPGQDSGGDWVTDKGDCKDLDENTFPGAAPEDDPSQVQCMTDSDGDGWGADLVSGGIDPGNDCDDTDADTYKGSAEHDDPDKCTKDADGDGYGDRDTSGSFDAGTDCDDSDPISTIMATDGDCDGILTADDCDDGDDSSTVKAADADCDDVLATVDCDDADSLNLLADDCDQDSVLRATDCDDYDNAFGDISLDGDCDGVLATVDCDDGDSGNTLADDCDQDSVLRATDCHDYDDTLGDISLDGDCDGVLATVDCDDTDEFNLLADDCDQDSVLRATDCDDYDNTLGDITLDSDCDRLLNGDYTFIGEEADDWVGALVSSAGDVDGDGLDDLLIGTDRNDTNGANAGKAYLVLGKSLGGTGKIDLSQADYSFIGEDAYHLAGSSVSSAGDVDRDGLDDLLIGARFYDSDLSASTDVGKAYLVLGKSLEVPGSINLSQADYSFLGENAGDRAGEVSSAGDVDGDGLDDLVIGASTNDEGGSTAGKVYLVLGKNLGVTGSINLSQAHYSFIGENAGDRAGFSLSGAGDVDGDGLDDLLIGASENDAGKAYLVLGKNLEVAGSINLSQAHYSFIGENAGDKAGSSVSGAGDVDGDGLDDLLIGAYENDYNGNNAGKAYLLLGASLQTPGSIDLTDADYTFIGENAEDYAGWMVSGAGDVDGDGLDELLIGASGDDEGGTDAGKVYLVLGRYTPDDGDSDGVVVAYDCDDTDPSLGNVDHDEDCDGVLYYLDCDDGDALNLLADDCDQDAVGQADDCDDDDDTLGAVSLDGDCDGVLATVDCDDGDAANTLADDCDQDTVLRATDCDDYDDSLGDIANDADCDGVLTTDDCDDSDALNLLTDDCDQDGVNQADDCDDTDYSAQAVALYYPDDDLDGFGVSYEQAFIGASQICAIDSSRRLTCWGGDGNGFITDAPTEPVDSISVIAGFNQGIALMMDGTVYEWGKDSQFHTPPPQAGLRQLNTGSQYKCATDNIGSVTCWGVGLSAPGQGGVYTNTPDEASFIQVAVSADDACALSSQGTLTCWGDDALNQVSDAPTGSDFNAVFAGQGYANAAHFCAIKSDGSLACWGNDSEGQCQAPTNAEVYVSLAAGSEHTCALTEEGTPYCWGATDHIAGFDPSATYIAIASFSGYTCALDPAGGVTCWGVNEYNRVSAAPAEQGYAKLFLGKRNACAITAAGDLNCWGDDSSGQLSELPSLLETCGTPGSHYSVFNGDCDDTNGIGASTADFYADVDGDGYGDAANSAAACDLPVGYADNAADCDDQDPANGPSDWYVDPDADGFGAHWTGLAISASFGCAIDSSGELQCWGDNNDGQVSGVPSDRDFIQVATGAGHGCAILGPTGGIRCWGLDDEGQVSEAPTHGGFVALGAGVGNSCALHKSGAVDCWGLDTDSLVRNTPTTLDFVQLSVGAEHACARAADNSLTCWGGDTYSQVSGTPATTDFIDIVARNDSSCARDSSGLISCWGQISASGSSPPVTDAVRISIRATHGCALNTAGQVECWGTDSAGEVNDVPAISGFVSVETGLDTSCALHSSGGILCWGADTYGQVSQTPTDSDFSSFVSADGYACGLNPVGLIRCWGQDNATQVSGAPQPVRECVASKPGYAAAIGDCDQGDSGQTTASTRYYVDANGNGHGDSSDPGSMRCFADAGYSATNDDCDDGDPAGSLGIMYYPDIDATVGDGDPWLGVAISDAAACAIDGTGQIQCWGDDEDTILTDAPTASGFSAISAGHDTMCAIDSDDALTCWGDGTPLDPSLPDSYQAISVGEVHVAVLNDSNEMECSLLSNQGVFNSGQCAGPFAVAFNEIAAGSLHTCALTLADNAISCWNEGFVAWLGDLPAGDNFIQITSGMDHSCALRSDRSITCFGDPAANLGQTSSPAGSSFQDVSAGDRHNCAVSAGAIECWGSDAALQVTHTPANQDFVQVISGASATCGLSTDGDLFCWGDTNHWLSASNMLPRGFRSCVNPGADYTTNP